MSESYGFLSTYPPTECGLATFTASLVAALGEGPRPCRVGVVQVLDGEGAPRAREVVHQMDKSARGSLGAARALDRFDVAVVQHEYGIYGGRDGAAVLAVAGRVHAPMVVVLHTVLTKPTAHQRMVLEELARLASSVVVMTETAHRRLTEGYDVDPAKVEVIAHGAPTEWRTGQRRAGAAVPSMLTWGLLGPGKGIEWVLDALVELQDLSPAPHYVVAGGTHPHIAAREGEAYRAALADRASRRGIRGAVTFIDRYLPRDELHSLVQAADVVLLPYDSTDQVTSGVLIEAVTARRPVVATGFPHATDLLSTGAGIIVARQDARAIADAVRRILTEPATSASMVAAAERLAPHLTWAAVAARYRHLGARLHRPSVPASA
ncbi:glycosyltransferase [Acidimicrobiaceae bacterium USS-CC1]|uniref:Glycosyltransferase n=1 Tax=Acidiferrimicrobium australe TaxID=2664430 RepID=A0ABW9QUG6_9ACTN|nr:glycosyltransferase [Acidiferrimicrobium australe]